MDEQVFQLIVDDIKEMKKDIKEMLQFKWQIVGGSIVVSLVVSLLTSILIAKIG